MLTLTVDEAKYRFQELVESLGTGDEIHLTKDGAIVARLVGDKQTKATLGLRMPSQCKGMLSIVSEDDGHLEQWKEYMPEPEAKRTEWPSKAGSAKHLPFFMADDFNAPLEEFEEAEGGEPKYKPIYPRKAGSARHRPIFIADDFNAPMDGYKE